MKKNNALVISLLAGITLLFSHCEKKENPTPIVDSPPGTVKVDVDLGGPTFTNEVFVGISPESASSTSISRTSWDLGFSTGSEFRVIINYTNQMFTKSTGKSDLALVTSNDSINLGERFSFAAIQTAATQSQPWIDSALAWVDHPNGELSGTAIAEVQTEVDSNMVYITNSASAINTAGRAWKKFKISRNGNGYTITYGNIGDTSNFQTVTVAKSSSSRFVYFSFTNGVSTFNPGNWDISLSTFTNHFSFQGKFIPYIFNDFCLINTGKLQAYMIDTAEIKYADFASSNIDQTKFAASDRRTIGSTWRYTGGAPPAPTDPYPFANRYYIIKQQGGIYYKLRFTAIVNSNGTRGYPSFEYIKL